ncbi:MAG: PrsW family intramembrane metalloprotease [Candidatus Aminicenantes bacterium]|nr:PrsW family intramembrane metalloprotease [Candidatus Aminicenantes bacterium]
MKFPKYLRIWIFYALIFITALILLFDEPHYFWIELQFALLIWIATSLTRSASTQLGIAVWSGGVGFSILLLLLYGNLLKLAGVNPDSVWMASLFFPVAEEIVKILPVVLFALYFWRKRKLTFNTSTFLFLGIMTAIGFSMLEKSYWENISFPFTYGPHLGGFYFFSDALGIYVKSKPLGFIGHGAATGLIAMGIGLGLYFRKFKAYRTFWWIFPLFPALWVLLEHCLLNLYYANGSTALLIVGGGQFTPWIFLAFLAATVGIDLSAAVRTWRNSPCLQERFRLLRSYPKHQIKKKRKVHWAWLGLAAEQFRFLNLVAWNTLGQIKKKEE